MFRRGLAVVAIMTAFGIGMVAPASASTSAVSGTGTSISAKDAQALGYCCLLRLQCCVP